MKNVAHPLKVLMVTPRYFPYVGGTETHVHEVGPRLAERGIHVTILTTIANPDDYDRLPHEETVEGMRVIRVRAWPAQRDYYYTSEIRSYIKKSNWDLVHCQGSHTFVPILAMLAAKQMHIPYVVTFHTGGHTSHIRNMLRSVQWHSLRPLLAGASRLIAVSRFEKEYFRDTLHLPEDQFSLAPNGFIPLSHDPELLTPPPSTGSLIVSVGRLERYKGHHKLIAALPFIRERCPDAHVLILGSGPYETALRELAQKYGVADHVEIRSIPPHERQTMMQLLSQASVVTLLSEYESQGIVVMEALALRRPVLVTDTSALHEFAEQRLVCAIPLKSDSEQIAQAVLKQIHHPILPVNFSLPTWDECADKLFTIYQQATS
ncbi:glycosyltransferase family 4 protein [Ktedonobacter racemifer]|uniref:Glycosyl transferase group 1 n=1 Tax=Ktedonobacter racemifer DSM 44963 TaxID=485913 RepID=D6U596_KTERA|nr:glycosyltransferase family 4 protein [Ktedonobacter racemifer]EFH81676.1 glycosyl transferase group 1 [Ktedonobacter racemifer DSM 44963]